VQLFIYALLGCYALAAKALWVYLTWAEVAAMTRQSARDEAGATRHDRRSDSELRHNPRGHR
jgi:hypothetical protein